MNSTVIRNAVESMFNTQIHIPSREREMVYMRSIYYKLCKDFTFESLTKIGKAVNKDHATVIHGLKVFDNLINPLWEKDYYNRYLKLHERLNKKIDTQVKRSNPNKFYREKYRVKLLQNKQMYAFTKNCLDKMESMGHKFTDVLRNKLDNIIDDKQFSNDNKRKGK
tara:strand:- start:116 stop:613 length:498 start_codon:yes stop_codon:yes gene_type:complete